MVKSLGASTALRKAKAKRHQGITEEKYITERKKKAPSLISKLGSSPACFIRET
jgi:hypothetical protein